MELVKCDVCGKIEQPSEHWTQISDFWGTKDICSECYESIKEFIKEYKKNKNGI